MPAQPGETIVPAHTPLNRQETLYLPRLEARPGTNDLVAGNPDPLFDDGMSGRALAGQAQRLAGLPPDRQYFIVSLALPAAHADRNNFARRLLRNRILTISAPSSPSKMRTIASGGRQGVGECGMEAHRLPSPAARDNRERCSRNDMDGKRQYAPRYQPFKALRDDARLAAGISEDRHRPDFAVVDWTPAPRLRPMGEGRGEAWCLLLDKTARPCGVIGSKPAALTPLPSP